jgi:hypothetical protein
VKWITFTHRRSLIFVSSPLMKNPFPSSLIFSHFKDLNAAEGGYISTVELIALISWLIGLAGLPKWDTLTLSNIFSRAALISLFILKRLLKKHPENRRNDNYSEPNWYTCWYSESNFETFETVATRSLAINAIKTYKCCIRKLIEKLSDAVQCDWQHYFQETWSVSHHFQDILLSDQLKHWWYDRI